MPAGPATSPDALAGMSLEAMRGVKTHVPFKVVLINPYELGRQPFAPRGAGRVAEARRASQVTCLDLSLQKLDPDSWNARLVALYVGMHTATRIAVEALPRISARPGAHLCVYGLYAPMNEALLRDWAWDTVLGGEVEPALLSVGQRLRAMELRHHAERDPERAGHQPGQSPVSRSPDRSGLPALALRPPGAAGRIHPGRGFAEGSRGCKHLCRHCPVVPVYQGNFRIVPVDVVMEDIRAAGQGRGDAYFLRRPGLLQRSHPWR